MAISIAELKRSRSAIKRERKTIIAQMQELLDKAGDSKLDGDDADRFNDMEKMVKDHDDRITDHDDRIEQLEAFKELAAQHAEEVLDPADDVAAGFQSSVVKANVSNVVIRAGRRPANEAKGTRFARFVIGAALGKTMHSTLAGARYIQDNFGDDEVFKALNTTTQAAGGALIPQDFRAELIELLYASTVVRGSGVPVFPMPAGNLTLPRLRGGMTATWLANELTDMTESDPAMDDLQLTAHKLTGLVAVSNDLIRRSPISVETIVRGDMVRQIALAEDLAFLTSDGSSGRPTGMLSLAGFTHTNSTSVTLAVVLNELQLNELNLRSANVPMDSARWFFNPALRTFLATLTDSVGRPFFKEELDRGTLNGFPYSMTNQLPTNIGSGTNQQYLFLAATDQLIIGDTLNMFADSSAEATYVSGGTTISAYQRDQTLFRVIEEVEFNTRHPQAISVSTVQSWIPTGFTDGAGAAYSTQTANTSDTTAGSAVTV